MVGSSSIDSKAFISCNLRYPKKSFAHCYTNIWIAIKFCPTRARFSGNTVCEHCVETDNGKSRLFGNEDSHDCVIYPILVLHSVTSSRRIACWRSVARVVSFRFVFFVVVVPDTITHMTCFAEPEKQASAMQNCSMMQIISTSQLFYDARRDVAAGAERADAAAWKQTKNHPFARK